MKKFFTKYWKRILIIIAGIFIVINVIGKCVAPRNLIEEYVEYGPNIESSESTGNKTDVDQVVTDIQEASPFNEDMFRLVMILVVGLVGAVVISEITTKKSSPAKKK